MFALVFFDVIRFVIYNNGYSTHTDIQGIQKIGLHFDFFINGNFDSDIVCNIKRLTNNILTCEIDELAKVV
jgi:hypothetical protein